MSGPDGQIVIGDAPVIRDAAGNVINGGSGPRTGPNSVGPVHPAVTAAYADSAAQNDIGHRKVVDGAGTAKNYVGAQEGVQDETSKKLSGIGDGKQMPTMPTVPQASSSPSSTPASTPAASTPSPGGVTKIDPSVLAALIQAVKAKQSENEANGVAPPTATDTTRDGTGATSPQSPEPLDVSEVSLENYPGGVLSKEQLAGVIDQALTINGIPEDTELRAQWQALYQHMAERESSGNPNAVNDTDTNAVGLMASDGHRSQCSRGIWQCIPSTFAANHMAGTSTSIYDPLASAAASINYVMQNYGVSADGSGLADFSQARGVGTNSYKGY